MINISPTYLTPNPWQPRQHIAAEPLAELAADIQSRFEQRPETLGLLQLPAARLVSASGELAQGDQLAKLTPDQVAQYIAAGAQLQTAYGHRRVAAFLELAKTDDRYNVIPLELVAWSDEEMATSAWAENMRRADLNPWEQAAGLAKMQTDFGWSQAELAERAGLSRSAVSNKLRLLDVDDPWYATAIKAGWLSERQALALKPLYDLPEPLRAEAETLDHWYVKKPADIREAAKDGESSDNIRSYVDALAEVLTVSLENAAFDLSESIAAGESVKNPTCVGCPLFVGGKGKKPRCGDPGCYEFKTNLANAANLGEAERETGIPALNENDPSIKFRRAELAAELLSENPRCSHLRLQVDTNPFLAQRETEIKRWPNVYPVCNRSDDRCLCLSDYIKHDPDHQKLAADQERVKIQKAAAKKTEQAIAGGVLGPAVERLAHKMSDPDLNHDAPFWRALALAFGHGAKVSAKAEAADAQRELAKAWLNQALGDQHRPKLGDVLAKTNDVLAELGIEPIPEPAEPVERWVGRLERLTQALGDLVNNYPPVERLKGNRATLDRLNAQLDALDLSDPRLHSALVDLDLAYSILDELLAVVSAYPDGLADFDLVAPFGERWPNLRQCEYNLAQMSPPTLRYIVALIKSGQVVKYATHQLLAAAQAAQVAAA